jgi:hypothetical protein
LALHSYFCRKSALERWPPWKRPRKNVLREKNTYSFAAGERAGRVVQRKTLRPGNKLRDHHGAFPIPGDYGDGNARPRVSIKSMALTSSTSIRVRCENILFFELPRTLYASIFLPGNSGPCHPEDDGTFLVRRVPRFKMQISSPETRKHRVFWDDRRRDQYYGRKSNARFNDKISIPAAGNGAGNRWSGRHGIGSRVVVMTGTVGLWM